MLWRKAIGRDGRRLGDEPVNLLLPGCGVEDQLAVRIERRHRADGADEHAHRMGIVGEALHELLDVLVHHRVHGDVVGPLLELPLVGQLAEEDEVGGLEIGAALGELFDRIAAVEQDALVAVDVGDATAARRGVHERGVVGHQSGVVGVAGLDFLEVRRANRAVGDRDVVLLARAVVRDRQCVRHKNKVPACLGCQRWQGVPRVSSAQGCRIGEH